MPVYEYKCPKGHVTSSLERIGTDEIVCTECELPADWEDLSIATRILSPTPTHFRFADTKLKR